MLYQKFKDILPHFGFQMEPVPSVDAFKAKLKPDSCYCEIQQNKVVWSIPKSLEQDTVDELLHFYQDNPLPLQAKGEQGVYRVYEAAIAFDSYEAILGLVGCLVSGFVQAFVVDGKGYVFADIIAGMNSIIQGRGGNPANNIDALFNAAQAHPKNAILQNYVGKTCIAKNDFETASKYFVNACMEAPHFGEPYSNMGAMMWNAGQKEKAFNLFCEALLRNPFDESLQDNFIGAGLDLGKVTEMNQTIEKTMGYYPEYSGLGYLKALLTMKLGKKNESISLLNEILQKNPHDSHARDLLQEIQGS